MKLSEYRELLDELRQVLHAWLDALHADLTTRNAEDTAGARSVPVSGDWVASSVSNVLAGYALRETTGAAAATVIIRNGTDATGEELVPVTLTAGESARDWFGARGPSFDQGVFVDVLSGSVAGAIFLRK